MGRERRNDGGGGGKEMQEKLFRLLLSLILEH
jgi:hypothetical protein